MDPRVKSLLVLGGGSAGFLAAITVEVPASANCRSPFCAPKILASSASAKGQRSTLPQHLHDYLKLDIKDFYRVAEPQWKLGIRFLWGKRPYFDYAFSHQLDTNTTSCPAVPATTATAIGTMSASPAA